MVVERTARESSENSLHVHTEETAHPPPDV